MDPLTISKLARIYQQEMLESAAADGDSEFLWTYWARSAAQWVRRVVHRAAQRPVKVVPVSTENC